MTQEDAFRDVHARIDDFQKTFYREMGVLKEQLADIKAAVVHPDPSHCSMTTIISNFEVRIDALETEWTAHKVKENSRSKFLSWIFGQNLYGLILLVILVLDLYSRFRK